MKNYSPLKPQNIYENSKKWVANSQGFKYEESLKNLEVYVESEEIEAINTKIILDLRQLTTWYEEKFIVEVFEGKKDAFDYLLKSFKYSLLQTEIEIANIARLTYANDYKIRSDSLIGLMPRDKGLTFCKGLALGCFQDSERLAQVLLNSLAIEWFLGSFTDTTVLPFILKVFCSWKNIKFKTNKDFVSLPECYEVITQTWKHEKSEAFENALFDACEYHIAESKFDTNNKFYQFNDLLYRIFPAEILAVLQLRRHLGLSVSKISHDLFRLPTVEMPRLKQEFDDELLKKVKQRASFEFGNLFGAFEKIENLKRKVKLVSLAD